MVNSSTVAQRWKAEVASHSTWTPSEFLKKVSSNDGITISKRQAYRALKKARAAIYGDEEKCFNKIWNYCKEIDRTNFGSSCHVKEGELVYDGKKRFLRFYMCWGACKQGYKFLRPIIGVDGCHLKGLHGGQLLLAIGVDGNDSVFPLAYAVVEGERRESWTWFLRHLKKDLSITPQDELELTFISDKQKGLLPAFEEVLPAVTHRFCVRHLHGNMKVAGFTGKAVKDGLWEAARATTVNSFTAAMKNLKEIDSRAYDWLMDKHPSEWSKSHFNTNAHCDMLVNNICECYNAVILDAREQPLLSCLETLRKKLMARLYECRKQALKWTEPICPRILKKIVVNEKLAGGYTVIQSDDNLFETRGVMNSAIWMKHGKGPVHDYVHPCYFIDTYLKSYGGSIRPMAGPNEWPESDKEPLLPPLYTAKPGRPKKLRKKGADEVSKVIDLGGTDLKGVDPSKSKDGIHLKRSHVKMHCTKCKKEGHNKRKCPEDPAVRERLANLKKRVRVKAKKGQVPASSSTAPSSIAPSSIVPPSTLPLPAEHKEKMMTVAPSTEVTADEIPMTSQPPILEDTQEEVTNSPSMDKGKK
ncbi:uncharacterized protein LOC116023567 [Ipomoea triloba]|uniref:uncharacterized protein LOC116023567 n=1 Tax=Ipomoea triloba TaxID=35885 RepID=UPI00125DE57C|nr:uncharacterized protein LOC116023567 [Ipomoea triloba]